MQSVVHVLTTSGIYGIFAVTFDLESAKLLVNALVSRHLDYCNSSLSGIAETDLTKLQRILNHLAHAVTPIYSQCTTAVLPSLATSKI